MEKPYAKLVIWIGIATFVVVQFLWIRGCNSVRAIDARQLPGTWRASDDGIDIILTLSADGSLRYQSIFQNSWIGFLGGNIDVKGRWALDKRRLVIEVKETPVLIALAGQVWAGRPIEGEIRYLNDAELVFVESELKFRKSLMPADK